MVNGNKSIKCTNSNLSQGYKKNGTRRKGASNTSNSEINPLVPGTAALARVKINKINVNNGINITIPR